jgi:C1A family cysteine protease
MRSFALAALAGFSAASSMSPMEYKFINFVAKHAKSYATVEEYQHRLSLFAETDRQIEEFNATETTSVHGHNKFSDWTAYEKSKLLGAKNSPRATEYETPIVGSVPDWTTGVNWVEAGAVSPVKDQGQCGSCWAFSSTGALESAYHLGAHKTGYVTQFSEQQLVDCVISCLGCNGGWPGHSFYYYESHGAYYEGDYPYTAADGTCTYEASQASNVGVSTYTKVTPDDYTALQTAIAQQPISVLIEADTYYFQSYTSGVLTNAVLCGSTIDHAVLAAGYGQENGVDYFLVKNSWAATWGENGYVKIAADASNNGMGVCGIQYGPIYPTY